MRAAHIYVFISGKQDCSISHIICLEQTPNEISLLAVISTTHRIHTHSTDKLPLDYQEDCVMMTCLTAILHQ